MTLFDPLDEIDFDAECEAPKPPRRAGITVIAQATHVSGAKAKSVLAAAGLRRGGDRKYLFDKAVEAILASLDPARSLGHVAGGDASALDDNTASTISALSSAKANYEIQRTRKMAIEIQKLEGKLVDRAAIISNASNIAAHLKAGLSGVGAKIAGDLAATADPTEAQRLVDAEIDAALAKICDLGAAMLGEASP